MGRRHGGESSPTKQQQCHGFQLDAGIRLPLDHHVPLGGQFGDAIGIASLQGHA